MIYELVTFSLAFMSLGTMLAFALLITYPPTRKIFATWLIASSIADLRDDLDLTKADMTGLRGHMTLVRGGLADMRKNVFTAQLESRGDTIQ